MSFRKFAVNVGTPVLDSSDILLNASAGKPPDWKKLPETVSKVAAYEIGPA